MTLRLRSGGLYKCRDGSVVKAISDGRSGWFHCRVLVTGDYHDAGEIPLINECGSYAGSPLVVHDGDVIKEITP